MNQINLQLVQNEYLSGLSRQVEELSRLLRNAQKNEKKLVAEKKNQWFINKAAENIAKLQGKIQDLEIEIERTNQGENMSKIKELFDQRTSKQRRDHLNFKRKTQDKIEKKQEEKSVLTNFFADQKAINKDARDKRYHMKKAYYHFVRTDDRFPDHLRKKLKTMTNNRGYIYNNITYYGELPENEYEPILLFERQRDGTLLTHEYTDDEYIVHSKPKNGRQSVIKREKIVHKVPEIARKMKVGKAPQKKKFQHKKRNHPYSDSQFRERKRKIADKERYYKSLVNKSQKNHHKKKKNTKNTNPSLLEMLKEEEKVVSSKNYKSNSFSALM